MSPSSAQADGHADRYAPRRPSRLRQLLTAALLVVCGLLAYMHMVGIPEWLIGLVRRELATSGFAFESTAVRLDLRQGIVLEDARLYRIGMIGPPAAHARKIVMGLDVFSFLRREFVLSGVRISDGSLNPVTLCEALSERRVKLPHRSREPAFHAIVRVELDRCEVVGIGIDRLTCLLEQRDRALTCREVRSTVRRDDMVGDVRGMLSYDADTRVFEAHVETLFDLRVALPLLESFQLPFTAKLLRRFDFGQSPPRCLVDIQSSLGESAVTTLDGSFWFKDASYRGVDLLRGDGSVHVTLAKSNSVVVVDPVFLVRPEGMARGGFTVDLDRDRIEFHGQTSFHPAALSHMIGVLTNEIAEWTFDGPLSITAEGVADMDGWDDMAFALEVEGRQMGYSNLVAESCSFVAEFNGPTITVSDVEGTLYNGEIEGSAEFVAPVGAISNVRYRVEASLYNADFERVARLLAGEQEEEFKGRFNLMCDVSGWMGKGNAKTAAGTGVLGIDDGRVFMLPVFGGLSKYMTKIIPGLDFVIRQSDAGAKFVIQQGKVHSEEINIKGDVLSLEGKGTCYFDGEVEFDVRLRLLRSHTIGGRLLHPIFYPLSKLFEFRLRGTVNAPEWYLVNFSSDVLERLGLKKQER